MIHTDRRWKGQVRRNYLNKLEGNGKGLLNPIGPAPDEDRLAKKNVMSYFKKKLPAALKTKIGKLVHQKGLASSKVQHRK